MDKQEKDDKFYINVAFLLAENSYAIRRKVGCLIVKNGTIISDGRNGTPKGFPNICEYAVAPGEEGEHRCHPKTVDELKRLSSAGWRLVTHPYVLHAESNAIAKLTKSSISSEGATLYVTDEPCLECAKLIIQSGITRVVYAREYRLHDGLELLKRANITINKFNLKENGN